jgi:hypothetical protein
MEAVDVNRSFGAHYGRCIMMEFSISHLGFLAKKADYSGNFHYNTVFGPIF